MAKFTVEFSCDNAAFSDEEGGAGAEVARILRLLSEGARDGFMGGGAWYHVEPGTEGRIRDVNGNTIGKWEWTA